MLGVGRCAAWQHAAVVVPTLMLHTQLRMLTAHHAASFWLLVA